MATIQKIKKRNGQIADFNPEKITIAVKKAFLAVLKEEHASDTNEITRLVVEQLAQRYEGSANIPGVEEIQDLVENGLMARGYWTVAKAYIIYRYEHTKKREEEKQELIRKIEEKELAVVKRDGRKETFSLEKIKKTLAFVAADQPYADVNALASQCQLEVYEGITTKEIEKVLVMVARSMIERDPAYSTVAARLLLNSLHKEAIGDFDYKHFEGDYRAAFVRNIKRAVEIKKLDPRMLEYDLETVALKLRPERDDLLRYLGLQTLNDRYFIADPKSSRVLETPQYLWMRVAMGLALGEEDRAERAAEFYEVISKLEFVPSTPTLFHAGTTHPQLSSCYLNTVMDDLNHIFKVYSDNAQLSKWAGGIGTDWSNLRATGALIKTAGIHSQGVIPFLKIANDVTVAINRSGRRRGATCVYMEVWHYDFEDFLELRKNTGDERRRTHDMNTASWVPDLFMKRVRDDGNWTFFSPDETPELHHLYGKKFDEAYVKYEKLADEGHIYLYRRIKARDLWKKMLTMLFETGHPWITWKDPSNIRSPQDHVGVVHNSNLCCMTADQRVVTSEGLVTVGYLYEKARTLGLTSPDGKAPLMNGPVNTVFGRSGAVPAGPMLLPRPNAPIVRIITREGYSHKVTPDHKVWVVDRGWVEAQDLKQGNLIETQHKEGLWGATDAPHEAYVCGIVAGDGTFMEHRNGSSSVMIDLWEKEFSLVEEVEEMSATILANGEHEFRTTSVRQPRFVGNNYKKRLSSAPLARALKKRGFTRETKLKVPEFIWTGTRDTVAAYLRGLYAADATVEAGEITTCTLASMSREFLGEIQILLANFGIKSSLTKMRDGGSAMLPDGRGGSHEYQQKELWRLMVTSIKGCRMSEDITGIGALRGNTQYLANLTKEGYAQKMHATFERLESLPPEDAYCLQVFTDEHSWTVNGLITKNTEITLNTSEDETAVCNLGSVNFAKHMKDGAFDGEKVGRTVATAMRMLDNVVDLNFYPTKEAKNSNLRHRPVGLGIMGFQDALYQLGIAFESEQALDFADRSMEIVAYYAIRASTELAKERGAYESYKGSKWERGILPQDTLALLESERGEKVPVLRTERLDWSIVREAIKGSGMRNSNCMAIAPTATISNIAGTVPSIEPIYKNIYVKSNISGDFTVVNPYLIEELKRENLWDDEMLGKLKYHDGSVAAIPEIPLPIRNKYKETFEIDMSWIIRAAAVRGRWIDQSQSLNIFFRGKSGKELTDLYLLAWSLGLKTTYYLRTMAASQVEKSTVNASQYGSTHTREKTNAPVQGAAGIPAAPEVPVAPPAVAARIPSPIMVTTVAKEPIATAPAAAAPAAAAARELAAAPLQKTQPKMEVSDDGICEACQ